jgi:hypothetical protein
MFLEASAYADRVDPVSSGIAISMFQDAVEIYIWTLVKERNITTKDQAGFVSNLEAVQKAGFNIPYGGKLLELNKARVGFKHYGNLPAHAEVGKFRAYVGDFLQAAMFEHFSVRFDELSLVDLVSDGKIREHLKLAEQNIAGASMREAAEELAKAKTLLFASLNKYVPKVDSHLRDTDRLLNSIPGVRGVNTFAYLAEFLGALREASLVALFRLPLQDYNFLKGSLPSASRTSSGKWFLNHSRSQYSSDECTRALSCIVNLSIQLEASM